MFLNFKTYTNAARGGGGAEPSGAGPAAAGRAAGRLTAALAGPCGPAPRQFSLPGRRAPRPRILPPKWAAKFRAAPAPCCVIAYIV